MTDTKERIEAAIEKFKLTIKADFVPWSESRSATADAKFRDLNLNWRVTLKANGHIVLTSDYSAGIGHIPGWKPKYNASVTVDEAAAIRETCEKHRGLFGRNPAPQVSIADFLYSLLSDATAIDYPTYEAYAESMGTNPDSRQGERLYRDCIEIGLKLRRALREDGLTELQAAFADY